MIHTVQIVPGDVQFEVTSGQTILSAVMSQNIAWPNRCRVGACGACLGKILQGDVSYDLEPVLSERERLEGWVFACLATPQSDIVLTLEG
ncbi:2Fe-2S iron-sulfur cluster-binding protein [Vibrio palustris]|uniref:Ferredoxin-1 n=1 Tax=Vibrio palustris TaxID=1918946 RepID=A0A1R4B3H3_9VIBR|nr:2Fe-2S iron-sulfur cluster-binding protein [Vibrio palustris]SJL83468.1 Ferredoxin-1 [Vibrio palustris]